MREMCWLKVEDLPVILEDRPVLCSALTSVRKATGEKRGEERWRRVRKRRKVKERKGEKRGEEKTGVKKDRRRE